MSNYYLSDIAQLVEEFTEIMENMDCIQFFEAKMNVTNDTRELKIELDFGVQNLKKDKITYSFYENVGLLIHIKGKKKIFVYQISGCQSFFAESFQELMQIANKALKDMIDTINEYDYNEADNDKHNEFQYDLAIA